ncbi:MAG: hypothetical protein ACLVFN_05695 [Enterocloster sp.]
MNPMNDHAQDPARLPSPGATTRILCSDFCSRTGTGFKPLQCGKWNVLQLPGGLTVVTLENAVYMNMKNDVAFLVDFHLNLYDTSPPGIPTCRSVTCSMWQRNTRLLPGMNPLRAPAGKDPHPNFVVFYNGDKEIGDSCVLKISDSFEHPTEDPGWS